MVTFFVADLHLHGGAPAITQRFLTFLRRQAVRADRLYILGDLFEYWIGDDAPLPGLEELYAELRRINAVGPPIRIMHGNRDFLLGDSFFRQSGCEPLAEPSVIDLGGEPTLLCHGDALCTDDVEHQQFRQTTADPAWQSAFLARPIAERQATAKALRAYSRSGEQGKPTAIMDVNQETVAEWMRRHGVHQMIHGHTHREAIHDFELDGRPARRIVLGDWHADRGSALACTAQGCQFRAC